MDHDEARAICDIPPKGKEAAALKAPQNFSELASHFARLSEIYHTEAGLDLADLLPALAAIVVELHEFPAGVEPVRRRGALVSLRMTLDRLYPSSVWGDDSPLIDGRFIWAIRERIAQNMKEIDEIEN